MYTHWTVIDTQSSLPDHKRIQRETKVYDFVGEFYWKLRYKYKMVTLISILRTKTCIMLKIDPKNNNPREIKHKISHKNKVS